MTSEGTEQAWRVAAAAAAVKQSYEAGRAAASLSCEDERVDEAREAGRARRRGRAASKVGRGPSWLYSGAEKKLTVRYPARQVQRTSAKAKPKRFSLPSARQRPKKA